MSVELYRRAREIFVRAIELPPERLDPRHRYSLWAHVDQAGDGEIRPGDLITTQNVPVRPEDVDRGPIEVPLTRI